MDPSLILGASSVILLALGLSLRRRGGRMFGVLVAAEHVAAERGHRRLTVTHVALALLSDPDVARDLEDRRVDLRDLYEDIDRLLAEPDHASAAPPSKADAVLRAMLARLTPLGFLPSPHRMLEEIVTSAPVDLRATLAKHGITAERWRTRQGGARGRTLPPSGHASGPYRTACGREAAMDVVLWNDRTTTMAFVIELLRGTFGVLEPFATRTMLEADRAGRAVAGTFDEEEARRLAAAAVRIARQRGFRLKITVEPSRRERGGRLER